MLSSLLAKNSCGELSSLASNRQPGQGELLPGMDQAQAPISNAMSLHTKDFGTLYPLPFRYMMMHFNEGEVLSALIEELHAITGCDNVHGLPHFLPSLPKGPDSDHGPIITTGEPTSGNRG